MRRGIPLIIVSLLVLVGLAVASLSLYRPPQASYNMATPMPVGMLGQGVPTAPSAQSLLAEPTAIDDRAMTVTEGNLWVPLDIFPAPAQIVAGMPIIVSFPATGEEAQRACADVGADLDAGQCALRGLTVLSVDDQMAHISLDQQQVRRLSETRDAGITLTVAVDNAKLMAATTTTVEAAAPAATSAPLPTTAPAATSAPRAADAAGAAETQPAQGAGAVTIVDGLPLLPIGVTALVILAIGGLTVGLRRRGRRATPAAQGPAPTGLSLDLGGETVQPLLDDDAAIAQMAQSEAARPVSPALDAPLGLFGDTAGGSGDLFGASGTPAPHQRSSAPIQENDLFGPHDLFAASAAPVSIVSAPVTSAVDLFGEVTAPTNVVSEAVVPTFGPPLPPARPAEALPPVAALDRPAALRWVKQEAGS